MNGLSLHFDGSICTLRALVKSSKLFTCKVGIRGLIEIEKSRAICEIVSEESLTGVPGNARIFYSHQISICFDNWRRGDKLLLREMAKVAKIGIS